MTENSFFFALQQGCSITSTTSTVNISLANSAIQISDEFSAMAAEAEAAREARAKVIAAEGEQKASR